MIEQKRLSFGHVTKAYERKETGSDGSDVLTGIVEGYLATWDIDRASDRFVKGAFADTINELQERKRPLRLKRNHMNMIGGFDPDRLVEDDIGLYGVAEINLGVQEGREAYMLAKQGVLSDFSVGFSADGTDVDIVDGIRIFKRAKLWETSLVDEPMNPRAVATMVRGAMLASKLPSKIASRDKEWMPENADERVRAMTGSAEAPSETYRNAFLFYDDNAADSFESYQLPVCDVEDGEMQLVPRAVFTARAMLDGAKGGIELPEEDRAAVEATVNELYDRMSLDPPFGDGAEKGWSVSELNGLPTSLRRDIIATKKLSRNAVRALADSFGSGHDSTDTGTVDEIKRTLREATEMRELKAMLKGAWK